MPDRKGLFPRRGIVRPSLDLCRFAFDALQQSVFRRPLSACIPYRRSPRGMYRPRFLHGALQRSCRPAAMRQAGAPYPLFCPVLCVFHPADGTARSCMRCEAHSACDLNLQFHSLFDARIAGRQRLDLCIGQCGGVYILTSTRRDFPVTICAINFCLFSTVCQL